MRGCLADLCCLADSHLTLRQIYADAPGQATLVWKTGFRGKEAAKEIETLFKELFPGKGAKRRKRVVKAKGKGRRP
jgi:chromosome partitioning protein